MAPDKINPPGQKRPYPQPTSTGTIPFHDKTRNISSQTAYYLWGDLKNATKTPLICLHGGPGVPHNYLLPISLVYADRGIPVLMYDQIGCGQSTHFQDKKGDGNFWTPELFMAELDNVKSHLGIKEFDLLGQSWGGMLAGRYAITQPPGLRKLIIANSPASMPAWVKSGNAYRDKLPADIKEVLDRCEREDKTSSKEYEDATKAFYDLHMCRLTPWPPELEASFTQLEEDNTVYTTMNGPNEFHVVGTLKEWSIIDELKKITAKTVPGGMLVMNGFFEQADDESTGPFFYQPSCRVKWVRFALSAHLPCLEETEGFVRALGMFLVMV